MNSEIEQLEDELMDVSIEINQLQAQLDSQGNKDKVLLQRIKDLQYQALFYIEKINNLKEQNK